MSALDRELEKSFYEFEGGVASEFQCANRGVYVEFGPKGTDLWQKAQGELFSEQIPHSPPCRYHRPPRRHDATLVPDIACLTFAATLDGTTPHYQRSTFHDQTNVVGGTMSCTPVIQRVLINSTGRPANGS